MEIIVPLAGPDFENPDGSTKADIVVNGEPLLRQTLTSRSWWRRGEVKSTDMIFVLRDTPCSRGFAQHRLATWFPNCRMVFLSGETRGAAFSALAGVALCRPDSVICVDLADIGYVEEFEPEVHFIADQNLGAIAPVFQSDWPLYSYIEYDISGRVIRTVEKERISNNASAGTYFFRNCSVYLNALAHNILNRDIIVYKNLFYVCPMFNGVIGQSLNVITFGVSDVNDIKKLQPD